MYDADSNGLLVAGPITVSNLAVVDGLFQTSLDFGANVFQGDARWLEIAVRSPHDPGDTLLFTTLDPRQPLPAAPYALQTRGIFVDENTGDVGIGLTTPQFPLQVHHGAGTGTVPANATAIYGSSASGYGLVGFSKGAARAGVWGENNATSGEARGVWGRSTFSTGIGVYAEGFSSSGANHALHAKTNSPDGYAGYFEGGKNYFEGDVGIGTPTPAARLDVAQGDIVVTDAGVTRVQLGGVGPGGELSVRNDDGTETLEILGGGSGLGATVRTFDAGTGAETAGIDGDTTRGGRIFTSSEDGFTQATFEPDVSTGGGLFVSWHRLDSSTGFTFDGNASSSGNPRMTLSSGVSPMTFDTNASGSASVVLPTDAIQASEILDEPGVANNHASSATMGTGSIVTLISRSITVPTDGFVVVLAQGDISITHTNGTLSNYMYGVNDTAGVIPSNQDVQTLLASAMPSGTYDFSASAHGLFSVTAGTHTFYFLGDRLAGGAATMFDLQLTLMFFPTAYGTTVSNLTSERGENLGNDLDDVQPPLSEQDIRAEQIEAEEFHQQRLQRELRQMQAQMQALQVHLDQVLREQGLYQPQPRAPRREPPISPEGTATEGNIVTENAVVTGTR